MFQEKIKALEELEKEKHHLNADKERITTELQKKEELLRIEGEEKMSLEGLIRDMEQKLV